MSTKQNEGRLFEDRIHNILSNTKSKLYREKEIRSTYSTHISGIDHLIVQDDYCIAIQDKHVRSKKPSNNDIHHFKSCVNDLSKIIKKKIIGVYLSIMEPTTPASKSIEFENKTNENEFLFINNQNIDKLIYELVSFLYKRNIYIYENEDLLMIDENIILE